MFDDMRSDDGLNLDGRKRERRGDKERPLADREVPLGTSGPAARVLSPAIHAWLDGELPEAAVRKGDLQRDVEFWKQLTAAAEQRRHLRTPAHLEQRIMAALPHSAPQLITPWWRREFVVTPSVALGVAAALIALSAAVTALVVVLASR
jgi:hypothetical protein